jgi:hypothetical protein
MVVYVAAIGCLLFLYCDPVLSSGGHSEYEVPASFVVLPFAAITIFVIIVSSVKKSGRK